MDATRSVLEEIYKERERQERKWGTQNHGPAFWFCILMEEVGEAAQAFQEAHWKRGSPAEQRALYEAYKDELIQVAAVAVAMIESAQRNELRNQE